MSTPTRKRPIRKRRGVKKKSHIRKNVPWRESAKKELKEYSESGLMLRGCRYKAEMTQKELAEGLGISQHHISEMENGKRSIGKVMAKRLAEFFKTDYRLFL